MAFRWLLALLILGWRNPRVVALLVVIYIVINVVPAIADALTTLIWP